MDNEVEQRVVEILSEDICEPVTQTSAFESLKMDSLDYLAFIVHVEEAFDVRIPGGDVAEFETPGDVIRWIEADRCA